MRLALPRLPFPLLFLLMLLAGIAATLILFAFPSPRPADASGANLVVNVACSPLSSSQATVGATQDCTVRVRNTGTVAASDIDVARTGGWDPTDLDAWKRIKVTYSNGSTSSIVDRTGFECGGIEEQSCTVTTLGPGDTFYMWIRGVKPDVPDGIGLSRACVSATGLAERCSTERLTLP